MLIYNTTFQVDEDVHDNFMTVSYTHLDVYKRQVYRMSDLNPSGMDTFTCTVNACVALSSEEHLSLIHI